MATGDPGTSCSCYPISVDDFFLGGAGGGILVLPEKGVLGVARVLLFFLVFTHRTESKELPKKKKQSHQPYASVARTHVSGWPLREATIVGVQCKTNPCLRP